MRRMPGRFLPSLLAMRVSCALAAAMLAAPAPGEAQIGFDSVDARPLGMSISGAVSMGAYQAGMNWALLELFRQAHSDSVFRVATRIPRYRLAAVTGASAGNINTLLWAIEACTDRRQPGAYRWMPPDSSLFWQVWIGIGLADMLRPKDPQHYELSLLNLRDVRRITDPLIRDRLRDASSRLHAGCRVPVGISLTRIRSDTLMLESLSIATQRFSTIFTARVDSVTSPGEDRMRFHHDAAAHLDGDRRFGKVVQLLPTTGVIATHGVLEAVQASSSMPVAFEPVRLSVGDPATNTESDEYFVDGGVFDNNPLSLLLALHGARNGGMAAPPLDVLYINPRQLRGALARASLRAPEDVPPGGLATLLALLEGAVGTARQYELQLIARERETERVRDSLYRVLAERDEAVGDFERELARRDPALARRLAAYLDADTTESGRRVAAALRPAGTLSGGVGRTDALAFPTGDRYRLFVSTRGIPLFSQHLASFAGFLGRPLREFDFWVGAYDALTLAVDAYTCTGRDEECRRREIAALLRDPSLVPEPGRSLMVALHDAEFAGGAPELARSIGVPVLAPDLAQQRFVLLALARAILGGMRPPLVAPPCVARTVLGQFLCRDGLVPALVTFRDGVEDASGAGSIANENGGGHYAATGDSSRADGGDPLSVNPMSTLEIVRAWSEDPACASRQPLVCRAEPEFVQLIERPEQAIDQYIGQLLERLLEIEHRLRDSDLPHLSWHAQTVAWFYYNYEIGRDPRLRFFHSSIPDRSPSLLRFVPPYLGAQIGASGYEARYRVLYPIRPTIPERPGGWTRGIVLSVPVILHWNAGPKDHERADWYVGAGLGVGVRTSLPVSFLVSELGVEVNGYTSIEHDPLQVLELQPYANVAAGALRLGLRIPHHRYRGRLYGNYAWSVSIGVNDVGGLLYWATR